MLIPDKKRQLSEYITDIRNVLNKDIDIDFGAIDYFPHQPMYLLADISKLTEDTSWTPKLTFVDGIKKMILL